MQVAGSNEMMVKFYQSGGLDVMSEEVKTIMLGVLSLTFLILTLIFIIRERGYSKQLRELNGKVEARKRMDEFEKKLESRMSEFSDNAPKPKVQRKDDYQLLILPEKQDPATDLFVPKVLVQYFWEMEQYELRLYQKTYLRKLGLSTGFIFKGPELICSGLDVESAVNIATDLYEKSYRSLAQKA